MLGTKLWFKASGRASQFWGAGPVNSSAILPGKVCALLLKGRINLRSPGGSFHV